MTVAEDCEDLGHQDERIVYEDDEMIQFWCDACGGEWFEYKEEL